MTEWRVIIPEGIIVAYYLVAQWWWACLDERGRRRWVAPLVLSYAVLLAAFYVYLRYIVFVPGPYRPIEEIAGTIVTCLPPARRYI